MAIANSVLPLEYVTTLRICQFVMDICRYMTF